MMQFACAVREGADGFCHADDDLGPWMRLSHLSLTNHKSVPDLRIDIREHLVLIGANETGKSTLLRLLDAAFNGDIGRLYSLLAPESFRDPDQPILLTITVDDLTGADKALFADEVEVTGDGRHTLALQVRAEIDPIADDVELGRHIRKEMAEPRTVGSRRLRQLGLTFLPAGRSPDRELSRGRTSALRSLLSGVDLGADAEDLEARLAELHELLDGAAAVDKLRTEVAGALQQLTPRDVSSDDVTVRLGASPTGGILDNAEVRLRDGASERSLTRQSDGFRAMATVAVQVLAQDGTAVLCVDEPETHLHPTAQRRMGRLLRDERHQAIVATHSPEVLAQFDPLHVVVLTGFGASRQLEDDPFTGNDKGYLRWWRGERLEPMTARSVLLVEGLADRIMAAAVAEVLGLDLDRAGVSLVEYGGGNEFELAIRLFGRSGFGVPLVILGDADAESKIADFLDVEVGELRDHDVRMCAQDLEDQYVRDLGPTRVHAMLKTAGAFSSKQLTELDASSAYEMLTFCGHKKRKVHAATSVASELTEDEARSLSPIVEALELAVERARAVAP